VCFESSLNYLTFTFFLLLVERRASLVPKFARKPSVLKTTVDVTRSAAIDALSKEKKATQPKESKALKAARLDARHKYVLGYVGDLLGLDLAAIEDCILEGDQLDEVDRLFAVNGAKTLLFLYQSKATSKSKRVIITDGTKEALSESCVYIVRTLLTKPITTSNMAQELNFGLMRIPEGKGGLLKAFQDLLAEVYIPCFRAQENLGVGNVIISKEAQAAFIDDLDKFQAALGDAYAAINDVVELKAFEAKPGDKAFRLDRIKGPQEYQDLAIDPNVVSQLEELLSAWCKQISQVLAESEQMRKEADDVGPRAELEYWKRRTAKFNGLLDQIKSPACVHTIGILYLAKSKLIDEWRRLDTSITEEANEAKDNVKYLYNLESLCEPLYKGSPVCLTVLFLFILDQIVINFCSCSWKSLMLSLGLSTPFG
jgi:dynein heavy chain